MTCAPVPTVSWTSPGPMPLPRAAAAVSAAPAATGRPAGSPRSARRLGYQVPGRRSGRGQQGRQQAGVQASALTTSRSQRSPITS